MRACLTVIVVYVLQSDKVIRHAKRTISGSGDAGGGTSSAKRARNGKCAAAAPATQLPTITYRLQSFRYTTVTNHVTYIGISAFTVH